MIEVRKRITNYQEKYRDKKDKSTAPKSVKREFQLKDSSWGERLDDRSQKLFKTMCIFFELPTKQCVEKILMAIKHDANYIRRHSKNL